MAEPETDLFLEIVGQQLSGVTFVMDYLQLQFNPPPRINVYTSVTVSSSGMTCVSGQDQFRNKLCEQITKVVKSVIIRDGYDFLMRFEDDSIISISLKHSDYVGPDALEFMGSDQWVVI